MFGKKTDPNEKNVCPLVGSACIEHRCKWYVHIRGKHPQSDADMDFHDCAVRWIPILLIENSKEMRHAGSAIESFRNEVVKGNEALLQAGEKAKLEKTIN